MTDSAPDGFVCTVLYGVDVPPDWDSVINLADRHFPRTGCAPDDINAITDMATLEFPDGTVEMRFHKGVLKQNGLPEHGARIVVSCDPNVRDAVRFGALCQLSRHVTKLASALSRRKDCVGVFVESTLKSMEARDFRKACRGIDYDRNPLPLWIGFGHTMGLKGLNDQPMVTLWTRGLAAFFGHEAELEPRDADLSDLRRTLGGFVAFLFTRGHGATEGETLNQNEVGQAYHVQLQPRGRMADTPVYELVRANADMREILDAEAMADVEVATPPPTEEPSSREASIDTLVLVEPGIRLERSAIIAALIGHATRRDSEVHVDNGPDRQTLRAFWRKSDTAMTSDVILTVRDYKMPAPMIEFLLAENPKTLTGASGLQMADGHVLIEATPAEPGRAAKLEAATLSAHSALALLSLPGVRGIACLGSGIFRPRIDARDVPASGDLDLPVDFSVSVVSQAKGNGSILVSRGLSELGDPELYLPIPNGEPTPALESAFQGLVGLSVSGGLTESTPSFRDSESGAVFSPSLRTRRDIGPVLELEMQRPPRTGLGLGRLFGRR